MSDNTPIQGMDLLKHLDVVYEDEVMDIGQAVSMAIDKATKAVMKNNKKSLISIAVSIKPSRSGELLMEAALNDKPAKATTLCKTLYTDGWGKIYLEEPRQPKLPIQMVKGGNE